MRQSDRFPLYAAAVERLKAAGRLYPAYETAEELDRRRKRMQTRGLPPIYDRAALKLSDADRARLEAEGRRPHWRFKLDQRVVAWTDLVRGESHIDCASLSDPVLVREDDSYLYTLPSVVDDIDLGITHVIRGEDHVTNTAVQIQLFEALGGALPAFGHHNLLVNASGEGLSKRSGALSLTGLREAGVEPLAVAALAVLTGSSRAVQPVARLTSSARSNSTGFPARRPDSTRRNSGACRPRRCTACRSRTCGIASRRGACRRRERRGVLARRCAAISSASPTSTVWWRVAHGAIEPVIEDPDFLCHCGGCLPEEPGRARPGAPGRLG